MLTDAVDTLNVRHAGRDPKRTRPEAKCRFLVNFVNGLDNSSSIPRYSPPLAGAFIVN